MATQGANGLAMSSKVRDQIPAFRSDLSTHRLCQRLVMSFCRGENEDLYCQIGSFIQFAEILCQFYIRSGFERMGWHPKARALITTRELMDKLSIQKTRQPLVNRFLGLIADYEDDLWRIRDYPPGDCFDRMLSDAHLRFPDARVELALLERCGSNLPAILTGELDALELLFPLDGSPTAEQLYRDSAVAQLLNRVLAEAVLSVRKELDASRGLRVLEIGAGTGAATRSILPALGEAVSEYFFTDVSQGLVEKARQELGHWRFMSFGRFDIEQAIDVQGFSKNSFNIVIAANVLHATKDLVQAIENTRQLLQPGGTLILLEGTRRQAWQDLIFGLLPGWWRFEDSLRSDYPLIGVDDWISALNASGFKEPAGFVPHLQLGQTILLATRPS
jgi:microcystin synthetase protein McyG